MKSEEMQMKGGTAEITSQGIAGRLRGAGLWYSDPQHSVVDGDERLSAHRKDIESIGKKANFFGNMSRYLWFAALPLFAAIGTAFSNLATAAGEAASLGEGAVGAGQIASYAIGLPAELGAVAWAVGITASVIGAGFWASQKAETLSVSKQFETSIVNARTTAQEIAKATEKAPTVVVTQPTPRSEARETKWVNKVGHEEPANKQASYVDRYAPDKAVQQSHAARAEAVQQAQAASIA